MNAAQLEIYLSNLGRDHGALISGNVIDTGRLIEVYSGALTLYLEPAPGLSLAFWAETKIFESLIITLGKTSPLAVIYESGVPSPYDTCVSRDQAIALLGAPIKSKGRFRMPPFMEEVGGWDMFEVLGGNHENLKVALYYDNSLRVVQLAFSLKKKAAEMDWENDPTQTASANARSQ